MGDITYTEWIDLNLDHWRSQKQELMNMFGMDFDHNSSSLNPLPGLQFTVTPELSL